MFELRICPVTMNFPIQSRSAPIHLLLQIELVLLAASAIVQVLFHTANLRTGFPIVNLIGLTIFGAMRFIFPDRWISKLLYTIAEFGLLLLLTFVGDIPSPALLYVVLAIRNCLLLAGQDRTQRRWRSIVTALAFVFCILGQSHRLWAVRPFVTIPPEQLGSVWIGLTIVFGLVFLFLQLLVDAVLAECKGQEQLAQANSQLRQYALQMEELATVRERNRIARDIHDSLGHSLTVFNIHISAALRLFHTDPAEAESLLVEVKQLGTQALQEVRESVSLLRTDPWQGRSLVEAIESLISEFQRTTGVAPTYNLAIDRPLSTELNYTIYRLVQESLTNICKHGAATEVAIGIHQTATEIQAIVQDNGKGFDLDRHPVGFGLQGMQERTLALAGELKVKTAPGRGCHIQAIFPLPSP